VTNKRLATHHGIIPQTHKITQTMFTLNWVPTKTLNYEKQTLIVNTCHNFLFWEEAWATNKWHFMNWTTCKVFNLGQIEIQFGQFEK
jgi:hypothetical protein